MLIGVPDDEANRTTCGLTFEYTTEQFYLVLFLAAGGNMALSWTAAGQFLLDEVNVNRDACGHSVDNAANGLTMTFAKGGQREQLSKCIAHRNLPFSFVDCVLTMVS
jgi:hypothetical protein